jgi:HPt (histidine-containing phosphotransfer) domain-containing protein
MAKEQLEIINEKIVEDAKDLMSERFPIMVQYFLEDTQMYLEQVEEGVKEKNAEIAISPAHTIKSSAKQLGVERVSDTAKSIEKLCREMIESNDSDFSQFEKLCIQLKKEINEAIPELNKLCD